LNSRGPLAQHLRQYPTTGIKEIGKARGGPVGSSAAGAAVAVAGEQRDVQRSTGDPSQLPSLIVDESMLAKKWAEPQ